MMRKLKTNKEEEISTFENITLEQTHTTALTGTNQTKTRQLPNLKHLGLLLQILKVCYFI